MRSKILGAIGVILALSAFAGVLTTGMNYIATASELELVSGRLRRHVLEEDISRLQKRIWNMEDRWNDRYYKQHGEYPDTTEELIAFMTDEARETYRNLVEELKQLRAELVKENA